MKLWPPELAYTHKFRYMTSVHEREIEKSGGTYEVSALVVLDITASAQCSGEVQEFGIISLEAFTARGDRRSGDTTDCI